MRRGSAAQAQAVLEPRILRPVATRNVIPGRWAVGRGLTRPILAYLVVVTLGVWVFLAVEDVRTGGDLVRAPVVAATALLRFGLGGLAFITLLLIPAMVLTIGLVHRFEATSRAARSVLGAASWAGWCLFVAITLAVASRVVLVPETLAGNLFVFAASGAGFSLLAFDGHESRPGKALTLLALAVTACVILGSIWMAGRWSGTA
jgi:heme/copper-type cytochrome/quinol oxidase subunit 4